MKAGYPIGLVLLLMATVSCTGLAPSVKARPEALTRAVDQMQQANGWYGKGCYKTAIGHFFEAYRNYAAMDDSAGIALALNNLGNAYRLSGDMKSAGIFLDKAVSLYRDQNDRSGEIRALTGLGALAIASGDLAAAGRDLTAAEKLAGDQAKEFPALAITRGVFFIHAGAYGAAKARLLPLLSDSAAQRAAVQGAVHAALGELMRRSGHPDDAVAQYEAALVADREAGYVRGMAADLGILAGLYRNRNNIPAAADRLERSLRLYALLGDQQEVRRLLDRIQFLPPNPGVDFRATLFFLRLWQTDPNFTGVCE